MKRLFSRIRSCPLKTRLSMPIVLVLVILLIGEAVQFAFVSSYIRENLRSSTESVCDSVCSHMDTRLRSLIERLYYIQLDRSVEENLTDFLLRNDSTTEAVTMSQLSAALSLYKASETLASSLILYTPKQMFTSDSGMLLPGIKFEDTLLYSLFCLHSEDPVYLPPMEVELFRIHRQVIPVVHRFQIDGYSGECLLIVNIGRQELTDYLRQAIPDDGTELLLVAEDGTLISQCSAPASQSLSQDTDTLHELIDSEGFLNLRLAGDHFLVHAQKMGSAPWYVICLRSEEASFRALNTARIIFAALAIVSTASLLLCIALFSRTVTKPLAQMCQQLHESEEQGHPLDFAYPYTDEIGTLTKSYNAMAHRTELLLHEQERYIQELKQEKECVKQEQSLKRLAELRALQAQINPHFLYNALDSIRWKAELVGAEDISEMTTALANLFRIGLSRGREIITVEQEITHVESYLKIQFIRYQDRLRYRLDVSPDILPLYTVKLILQPLVENAIYHGIKESDHIGTVEIQGYREGNKLILRVLDDGLGIPPERLHLLQEDLDSGLSIVREGYGIFNVNERIRLHFGKAYGLRLENRPGGGTIATLTLPCITVPEEENNVSDFDC